MMFYMNRETYISLIGPVLSISLLTTVFFFYCLLVSKFGQEEDIKKPLSELLWSVVGWNGAVQLTIIICAGLEFTDLHKEQEFWLARSFLLQSSIQSTLSASAWLSVFYFIQIVPAHCPIITRMKRNIKNIVDWGLTVDRGFIGFAAALKALLQFSIIQRGKLKDMHFGSFTLASLNDTEALGDRPLVYASFFYVHSEISVLTLQTLGVVLLFGVMVVYLWKHMKKTPADPSSFISSLESQRRVTIMIFIQVGLYVYCSVWIIVTDLLKWVGCNCDKEYHILTAVISLFSLGTALNLGFGQPQFWQRAVDLWNRAVQIAQRCRPNRE